MPRPLRRPFGYFWMSSAVILPIIPIWIKLLWSFWVTASSPIIQMPPPYPVSHRPSQTPLFIIVVWAAVLPPLMTNTLPPSPGSWIHILQAILPHCLGIHKHTRALFLLSPILLQTRINALWSTMAWMITSGSAPFILTILTMWTPMPVPSEKPYPKSGKTA